ncbi:MAG: FG-GAP repeat domain-containing protein [Acidobacteriaceae bacterium]
MNGDGHQDIIDIYGGNNTDPASQYPGTVVIYLGDGHGNFQESSSVDLPVGIAGARLADFNHDGKCDLVVLTANPNNGAGSNTRIDFFLNHGDGTFTNSQSISDTGVTGAAESLGPVGDFNQDGKTDVVILNAANNGFRILNGRGNGTFQDPQRDTYVFDKYVIASSAAADLNHDGKLDLVFSLAPINTGTVRPTIVTLLAKQTGGFYWYAATSIPGSGFANSAHLSDVDGDGKLDVSYLNSANGEIRVLKGDGNGKFGAPQYIFNVTKVVPYFYSFQMIAAPLKIGGRPSIFFSGQQTQQGQGYLGVLLNQSR